MNNPFSRIKESVKTFTKPIFKTTEEVEYPSLVKELLTESKGLITPDFSDSLIYDKTEEFVVPHRLLGQSLNWGLYAKIYNNVGIVKNAIDNTTNFAVQSGYEFDGDKADIEKAKKWADDNNLDAILTNALTQAQIFGNAYYEFEGLKFLPVETMYVIVSKDPSSDGELIGYTQLTKSKFDLKNAPRWEDDEIIHFKYGEIGANFYGMPILRAGLASIQYMLQYQTDIGEILHRYGHPKIHWQVGAEDDPSDQTSNINAVKGQLDKAEVGEDIITSAAVKGNVLLANLNMIQPDGLLKLMENQVISALQVPDFFVRGGTSSNRSTADTELQAFDRKVKALRSIVGKTIEREIFKKKLNIDVKFAWRELGTEGELTRSNILKNLCSTTGVGLPVPLGMEIAGYGPWVDDFEEAFKAELDRKKKLADLMPKPQIQPGQDGAKPGFQPGKPKEYYIDEFTPPKSGDASSEVKKVLKTVYDKCRQDWVDAHPNDPENKENKTKCSKIAWSAAKRATGYSPEDIEPQEEDFDNQSDYVKALEKYKKGLTEV